ncbi:MAG: hypothetical protein ABW171_01815 [Steroidobacter sp.]
MKWMFTVLAALPLSGCVYGRLDEIVEDLFPPDFTGDEITRKRVAMTQAIDAAFATLDANKNFAPHATATHDRCYREKDNWKYKRSFAHSCRFRVTHFYGMNGDFLTTMLGLENQLAADGWKLPHYTLREVMTNPYDGFLGDRPPYITRTTNGKPLVSNLRPPDGYKKGKLTLEIIFAERETTDLFPLSLSQYVEFEAVYQRFDEKKQRYDQKDFRDVPTVVQDITQSYKYVLAISLQGTYFQD